jgi:hypothetical protein
MVAKQPQPGDSEDRVVGLLSTSCDDEEREASMPDCG